MRQFALVILCLAFWAAALNPVAADFNAYPQFAGVDNFVHELFDRMGAKISNFNVSEPLESGALKRYSFELGFTMSEPEKIPELIRELEGFQGSDIALRASSMVITITAEPRRNGRVIVYSVLNAHLINVPKAEDASKSFPNDMLTAIFKTAKFEPAEQTNSKLDAVLNMKRRGKNDKIDIWLTNLRVSGEDASIQMLGYANAFKTIRSAADGIVASKAAVEVAINTISQTSYSKLPVLQFEALASMKKMNPRPEAVFAGIEGIIGACDTVPGVFSGLRISPAVTSESGDEIPMELSFNAIEDAQWDELKGKLSALTLNGSSLANIGELCTGGKEGEKTVSVTLAISK